VHRLGSAVAGDDDDDGCPITNTLELDTGDVGNTAVDCADVARNDELPMIETTADDGATGAAVDEPPTAEQVGSIAVRYADVA